MNALAEIIQHQICIFDQTFDEGGWYDGIQVSISRFASASGVEHYTQERAVDAGKAKRDVSLGKYGEIFTNQLLMASGFPRTPVDCRIYGARDKSFAADLPFRSRGHRDFPDVHVKTCNAQTVRFVREPSWTFQWRNQHREGGKDSLFSRSNPKDVVAFVYIQDSASRLATIVATAPFHILASDGMLRLPRREDKRGLKRCVYYSDLKRSASTNSKQLRIDDFFVY